MNRRCKLKKQGLYTKMGKQKLLKYLKRFYYKYYAIDFPFQSNRDTLIKNKLMGAID